MCPRQALIGERNETSVLFSLATSSAAARPAAKPAPATTESSSLIDIRALCRAATTEGPTPARADDIVDLGSGGAFAPFLAPPLAASSPAVEARAPAPSRRTPLIALAIATVFVAMTAIVSIAVTRPARASSKRAPTTTSATTTSSPTTVATTDTSPPTSPVVATTTTTTAQSSAASPRPPVATSPATATTAARTRPRASSAPPAGTAPASPSPAPAPAAAKCCPGESDLACHMRIATGGKCG